MGSPNAYERLLNFTRLLYTADRPFRNPVETAQTAGWLDSSGRITHEGMAVIDAIGCQDQTRSVFNRV